MKECQFLKGYKIALANTVSSSHFRAALDISKVRYDCFEISSGLFSVFTNNHSIFPDLLFTSSEEITSLGLYKPIWNEIFENNANDSPTKFSWAIKSESKIFEQRSSVYKLLTYIDKNKRIFAREFAESNSFNRNIFEANVSSIQNSPSIKNNSLKNKKSVDTLLSNASEGEKLSYEDAVVLSDRASTIDLGLAANLKKERETSSLRTSTVFKRLSLFNQNSKIQNLWRRNSKLLAQKNTVKLIDALVQEAQYYSSCGGSLLLIDHSLPPLMTFDHLTSLIEEIIKETQLDIATYGAGFIEQLALSNNINSRVCLEKLSHAGVNTIFDDDRSNSPKQWLDLFEHIHSIGLFTTSTARIQPQESWQSRIYTLYKIRSLQEVSSGFSLFVPEIENPLFIKKEYFSELYLRTISLSRLFFDSSISVIGASKNIGTTLSKTAISYGADPQEFVEVFSIDNRTKVLPFTDLDEKTIDKQTQKKQA